MTIVARLVRNTIPLSLPSLLSQTPIRSVSTASEGWAQITCSVLLSLARLRASTWNLWVASREPWATMRSLRCSWNIPANKTYSGPHTSPPRGSQVLRTTHSLLVDTRTHKWVYPAPNENLPLRRQRSTSRSASPSTTCAQASTSWIRRNFRGNGASLSTESSDFLVGNHSRISILEMQSTRTSSPRLRSAGEILWARATRWCLGWISCLSRRTRRSIR